MKLLPYQEEAVRFVSSKNGRALIALDMGLGKTPVACRVALHFSKFPVVVICPASLRLNWAREIERWTGINGAVIQVFRSPKEEINQNCQFFILSYEAATKRALDLALMNPEMVIVDESHYIKNRDAQRTKQLVPLCRRAPRCLLLTGTPILNRPIELWCQLEALNFSLGTYWNYAKRYCNAHRNRFGWDVSGSSNIPELSRLLRAGPMIRMLKSEVLDDLPPKRRVKIAVEGVGRSSSAQVIRDKCEQALKVSGWNIAAALKKLREEKVLESDILFKAYSELAEMKIKSACDIALEMAVQAPLVIYAHHQVMLKALITKLSEEGLDIALIDGKTNLNDRQKAVDDFQAGKLNAVVCSITAASTGITLTHASDMLICELPWSPGLAMQAEDRIHRIGQKNCALIRYLVAEGTLDEALWGLVINKSRTIHSVLDGAPVSDFRGIETQSLGNYWDVIEEFFKEIVRSRSDFLSLNGKQEEMLYG